MKNYWYKNLLLLVAISSFAGVSKVIFDKVHLTSKNVIDEEFHLPQGLQYCNYNFSTWDPKITTLPGLYLISTAIFGPVHFCTVYNLRLTNLIGCVVNFLLFYVYTGLLEARVSTYKRLLQSINISLLPPLYFFSNLYYTDIWSLTFTLLLIIFNHKNQHILSSVAGFMAIVVRQTNVIWLLMVFGEYGLNELFATIKGSKTQIKIKDWIWISKNPKALHKLKYLSLDALINILSYIIVIVAFALFIFLNGSIVVGDKSAHTPSLHLPQIFYYSLFYLIFSLPTSIAFVFSFFKYINSKKIISCLSLILIAVVVHFNTQVHPYLVADNRHYTFYVWTRFYGKYLWFRYAIIPVYFYSCYVMLKCLSAKNNVHSILSYILCVILTLIPQRLIEIRYFLTPYVILVLKSGTFSYRLLVLQTLYFIVINALTINIFFTKDIYWKDFDYVQKLIW